jgi:hypothetical protein
MDAHPDSGQASEHPFIRALATWEAWSSADTWNRVVAHARQEGRDLSELGNLEELTRGPDPLEALRANRAVVELMTGWQWQAIRAARRQGCGWVRSGGHSARTLSRLVRPTWRQWIVKNSPPMACQISVPCCAMTPAGGTSPMQMTPAAPANTPPMTTPPPPPPPATLQTAQRLARVRLGLVLTVAVFAAGVAALGYLVSFEAISAFVVRIGAFPERLRWCGPLLVDTFITIATLFLVWLALSGVRLRHCWDAYYAWSLIAVATVASAYLNAAHVQPSTQTGAVRWDARFTAGAVPFAVLASVHLLVVLLLRVLAWTPTQDTAQQVVDHGERASAGQRPDSAEITPPAAPRWDGNSGQDNQLARRVTVRELVAGETTEMPVSWQDVQAATGLSRSRSYALLRQERETLAGTNGHRET